MMRKLFDIPENRATRLWNAFIPESYEELSKEKTVADCSLQRNQVCMTFCSLWNI